MWIIHTAVYCVGVVLLVLAAVFCLATGLYTAAGKPPQQQVAPALQQAFRDL
jgi:hypothetical protein